MTRKDHIIVGLLVAIGMLAVYNIVRNHAMGATQAKPTFCMQMREEAEQDCGIEMENSFMDQGGDNYTRGVHLKDMTKCRRIGEAVSLACNKYGKE